MTKPPLLRLTVFSFLGQNHIQWSSRCIFMLASKLLYLNNTKKIDTTWNCSLYHQGLYTRTRALRILCTQSLLKRRYSILNTKFSIIKKNRPRWHSTIHKTTFQSAQQEQFEVQYLPQGYSGMQPYDLQIKPLVFWSADNTLYLLSHTSRNISRNHAHRHPPL